MKKQLHVIFKGNVQGVGFRYTTERFSARFEVTGYVKNLQDGTVELLAEGEQAELEAFFLAIRESSLQDHIRESVVSWHSAEHAYSGFRVVF